MESLAKWLQQSPRTIVFTGAGMSTESGLSDFRSQTGLWRGLDPQQLASTKAMRENRDEFAAFYRKRIEGLLACQPHAGHELLAKWEQRGLVEGIITQNVDGFHQRAGSQAVAQLHGTLSTVSCIRCQERYSSERYLQEDGTRCACGGFVRPDVVLFGEALPPTQVEQAVEWAESASLFLVLGSSLTVSPANWFPQRAKESGARLVIVSQEPTPLDDWADLVVRDQKIGELLSQTEQWLTS
ncbi:NAD-dependent deacylase [Brevibacillus parabrevis]|uniref:NAD-dependent deacylase n=1 Tax=Brevibacillus parabrevis TaxID=54914 RepID=UPI0028531862|nr:NAD-dependent deacylase [Brevibacillus parabrevis]MDR5000751.1 NAD-dependent deacylase [Brevibacillus parabrevis]